MIDKERIHLIMMLMLMREWIRRMKLLLRRLLLVVLI